MSLSGQGALRSVCGIESGLMHRFTSDQCSRHRHCLPRLHVVAGFAERSSSVGPRGSVRFGLSCDFFGCRRWLD